jgi:hypothetical protein
MVPLRRYLMGPFGTCDYCSRMVKLTQAGTTKRHDITGPVIRARIGNKRRGCPGSGRWPRRTEQ